MTAQPLHLLANPTWFMLNTCFPSGVEHTRGQISLQWKPEARVPQEHHWEEELAHHSHDLRSWDIVCHSAWIKLPGLTSGLLKMHTFSFCCFFFYLVTKECNILGEQLLVPTVLQRVLGSHAHTPIYHKQYTVGS